MSTLPSTLSNSERACLADYAKRCLRDQADRDYIAARLCYKGELHPQFLWSSLQALEKYLKAILVFSYRPAKYSHDLGAALAAVKAIPELQLSLPPRVERFISFVHTLGTNRYIDRSYYLWGEELFELDWSVWHVRRFCQNFYLMPGSKMRREISEAIIRSAQQADIQRPHRFRLSEGFLERVLQSGPETTRQALVFKNPCFGRTHRTTIQNYPIHSMSENPTHVLHPEIVPILSELVYLPPVVTGRKTRKR